MATDWEDILGAEGADLATAYEDSVAEAIEHYNSLSGMAYTYNQCMSTAMAYYNSLSDRNSHSAN